MENIIPMKNSLSISLLTSLVLWTGAVKADEHEKKPYYIGLGLTASVPEEDSNYKNAAGFQIYGGYKFENENFDWKILNYVDIAIEAGFHDTGDYDGSPKVVNGSIVRADSYNSAGIWAAGVFSYNFSESFDAQGTLGVDLGDDDGVLFGGGVVYHFNDRINLNFAIIKRPESQSTQFNATYQF